MSLAFSRQAHALRTARGIVGNRQITRTCSNLGWRKRDLDQATGSGSDCVATGILDDLDGEVPAGRNAADIQRSVSSVGESDGFRAAGGPDDDAVPLKGDRHQTHRGAAALPDATVELEIGDAGAPVEV